MTQMAWVNGVYMAADEARISPFDRGFLFADGVYEVTAVYGGRLIDMERHLDRLERSLRELKFGTMPDRRSWRRFTASWWRTTASTRAMSTCR